ncbi:phenylacetate--CoA ligase family protein [Marinilabiliaceae bacterium JC017]|nr:phenylacetate--CoA ligase family protein [Marinilabiliaceae bacterium JC017]
MGNRKRTDTNYRREIAKHFFLSGYDLGNGLNVKHYFHQYSRMLTWSKDELEVWRVEKLKKLLIHAGSTIPFYKQRFQEAGFDPFSVTIISDLEKLPPLTRQDIQEHREEMTDLSCIDGKKIFRGLSSGSTGKPVRFIQDKQAFSSGKAAILLGWTLGEYKIGMRGMHIWGNSHFVKHSWTRVSSKIKSWVFNQVKFPAYKLYEKGTLFNLYQTFRKGNFDYLDGYTNAIYLFAHFLMREGLEVPRVKCVMTTAENLHAYQRHVIEEMLGPVYDEYGCREINGIAFQCRYCQQYHVISPKAIVEFEPSVSQTGEASLLITDLENYVMPLIRYKNGDMGRPGTAACSVPFDMIGSISGRESDMLQLADGRHWVVPSFFGASLLNDIRDLKHYQVVKTGARQVVINLVVGDAFDESDLSKLDSYLNDYLGDALTWNVNIVDNIMPDKNGKYKLLVDKTKVDKCD